MSWSEPVKSKEHKVATKPIPAGDAVGDKSLGKCAKAIIVFLAAHADREWSKAQVAVSTGYSVGSGGFNNALADLNTRGFIIRSSKLQVNSAALPVIESLIGEIEPVEYNIDTFKENLGKCEREIYEVLLENSQEVFSKEDLAAATPSQYSPGSGGFNNALSRLNTLELIIRENGKIQLNPELCELL